MPANTNRQILLAARPKGAPKPGDFKLSQGAIPSPGDGQVLTRTIYMSLDPYMRGRMNDVKSYAPSVEIGGVMTAGAASEVMESKNPRLKKGDIVFGYTGWQDYAVSDAASLRKLDPAQVPISTSLGVLGMPGMTAWAGLRNIGQPKTGETLVVAAASGPVGSLVGQIARLQGARAVGIAGSAEKCAHVTKELGFDACISHRDKDFAGKLAKACPKGIDVYWENVGGAVFEAVLPLLNPFARIPVCGLVAHYNATALPEGPNKIPLLMRSVLTNRLRVQGFIVFDFAAQESEFLKQMTPWVREGRVAYREDFVDGLENAPDAFIQMLDGGNFGKLVVRVNTDPTA